MTTVFDLEIQALKRDVSTVLRHCAAPQLAHFSTVIRYTSLSNAILQADKLISVSFTVTYLSFTYLGIKLANTTVNNPRFP
jgi:hypothetical protein